MKVPGFVARLERQLVEDMAKLHGWLWHKVKMSVLFWVLYPYGMVMYTCLAIVNLPLFLGFMIIAAPPAVGIAIWERKKAAREGKKLLKPWNRTYPRWMVIVLCVGAVALTLEVVAPTAI